MKPDCLNTDPLFWRGLCVTWSMAHKLIQHLRRTGWRVTSMPRGQDFIGCWCTGPDGDYFSISFWEEHVACIENPAYDFQEEHEDDEKFAKLCEAARDEHRRGMN